MQFDPEFPKRQQAGRAEPVTRTNSGWAPTTSQPLPFLPLHPTRLRVSRQHDLQLTTHILQCHWFHEICSAWTIHASIFQRPIAFHRSRPMHGDAPRLTAVSYCTSFPPRRCSSNVMLRTQYSSPSTLLLIRDSVVRSLRRYAKHWPETDGASGRVVSPMELPSFQDHLLRNTRERNSIKAPIDQTHVPPPYW